MKITYCKTRVTASGITRCQRCDSNRVVWHKRTKKFSCNACDENLIIYKVYCKGRKIEQFTKHHSWPFIWGRGTLIRRKRNWYKVGRIIHMYYLNQVRIYVKPFHKIKEK